MASGVSVPRNFPLKTPTGVRGVRTVPHKCTLEAEINLENGLLGLWGGSVPLKCIPKAHINPIKGAGSL